MGVKLGTSNTGSMGEEIAPGVYGKTGKIVNIVQQKDKVLGTYEPDLFITFEIDSGGDWNDEIDVFGSFKRDERTGEVLDWGGAFRIDQVFKEIGAYDGLSEDQMELTDELTLPSSVTENALGTDVCFLLFAAGKNPNKDKLMWNTFPRLSKDPEDPDKRTAVFKGQYAELKKDNYNYEKLIKGRDYMEANSKSGKTTSGTASNTGTSKMDDLPF